MKKAHTLLLLLFTVICSSWTQDNSQDKLNGLRQEIDLFSSSKRLDTLNILARSYLYTDPQLFRIINTELEEEAIKQKDFQKQANAYGFLLEYYIGFQADNDSVLMIANIAEEFTRKHQLHTTLFTIQQMIVQYYSFRGEFAQANKKAEALFQEAKELNNNYGMAVAAAGIGNIYNTMGVPEDAIANYKKALELLQNEEDKQSSYLCLNLYDLMNLTLMDMKKYIWIRGCIS